MPGGLGRREGRDEGEKVMKREWRRRRDTGRRTKHNQNMQNTIGDTKNNQKTITAAMIVQ